MVALGVLRKLLDLIGLASLLPVVTVMIYPASVEESSLMASLFRLTGLDTVAGFGVALGVFALVLLPLKSILVIWLGKIQNSYLLSIYRHYSRRLYDYYHDKGVLLIRRTYSSQLAFHINGACWGFAMSVVGTIVNGAAELVIALLLISAVLWFAPLASVVLLAAIIPVLLIYFGVVKNRLKKLGADAYEARRRQSRIVQESLRGHVSINVNDSFDSVTAEFEQGLDEISAVDLKNSVYGQIPPVVVQICIALVLIVLLAAGGGDGSPTATFILFGFAAARIMPSAMSLAGSWNTLQNSRYIVDIIRQANEFHPGTREDIRPMGFEHHIEMKNVTFAFENGEPVLSNLSIRFNKGESVGVRGESGAGKSTLFNLLLGFYTARSGGIYIDGERLSPANRKSWHRIVGYVEQEVFIKNDTLAKNIALSAPEPDSERIWQAMEQVGLARWARGLEKGLETVIGEGGSTLSGGERQRIGIARALYKLPQVLFLDEATSALDALSERELVSLLRSLTGSGLTLFVISHRDSTLGCCDRIVEI